MNVAEITSRYCISRERDGEGQVEWSDRLIRERDVLAIIGKYEGKSEDRMFTFKVIDKKTGKEPTDRVIHNLAKKGGLMTMDIDQFFVGEDGTLILVDDCGNATWCDSERFMVVMEERKE